MVVTDIMMPVMDGPTFIQAIRKKDARVSIVAISGYLTESGLPHGLDELVQAVLPKPFTVTTLLETLDRVLRSRTGEAP